MSNHPVTARDPERTSDLPQPHPTSHTTIIEDSARYSGTTPTTTKIRRVNKMFTKSPVSERKPGGSPGFVRELKTILFGTWFNLLLLAIPISWALHFTKSQEYTLIFIFSSLAIIPLAKLLAFATDELSIRVGEALAGLINATLGNAVELIVAILALIKCELRIVQSSLFGSILSNLLLVLGFCFFAGGTKFSEQGFAVGPTQLNSSLLTIGTVGLLIPVAFHAVSGSDQIGGFGISVEQGDILKLSYCTAIVLLVVYLSYIYFQLFSHKSLYDEKPGWRPETIQYAPRAGPSMWEKAKAKLGPSMSKEVVENDVSSGSWDGDVSAIQTNGYLEEVLVEGHDTARTASDEDDGEIPELSLPMTIGLLVVVTILVAITAEWLVDSIDGLARARNISKEFIGLILLPIVGNAAEHVTAVSVSVKDKLTMSLGIAIGSCVQIALFVIPLTVILGWIMGHPLTMLFDPFEAIVLFLSVLTVNYVVQNGKSNWLDGVILISLYAIIAVVFWFYPGTEPTGLLTCSAYR